jgi:hypothetical protein
MAFKKPKNRALDFALALVAVGIVFGAFSGGESEEEKKARLKAEEYMRRNGGASQ